jgi:hypothetical protein
MDPGKGIAALKQSCCFLFKYVIYIPGVGVSVSHMEHGLDWRLWLV